MWWFGPTGGEGLGFALVHDAHVSVRIPINEKEIELRRSMI